MYSIPRRSAFLFRISPLARRSRYDAGAVRRASAIADAGHCWNFDAGAIRVQRQGDAALKFETELEEAVRMRGELINPVGRPPRDPSRIRRCRADIDLNSVGPGGAVVADQSNHGAERACRQLVK
nr:hypothetical protein [Methylocapsa sp. RX1]